MQRQEAYQRELQEVQDRIEHQRRVIKYQAEEEEQKKTLKQHEADLVSLQDAEKRRKEQERRQAESKLQAAKKASARASQKLPSGPIDMSDQSESQTARAEWEHLKQFDGAQSTPLDELMSMIGLEEVKQAFLSTKSKVDTALRQGISLSKERFGCCMLGNPGTGLFTPSLDGQIFTN